MHLVKVQHDCKMLKAKQKTLKIILNIQHITKCINQIDNILEKSRAEILASLLQAVTG